MIMKRGSKFKIKSTFFLLMLAINQTRATPLNNQLVQKIRHIGLPTKGKYTVREETEKAPSYEHPCNLTRTAVKISFPDEMRSEIFVNLLGYKEPNLVHLQRCKGLCGVGESALACRPTRVREKKVRMMIRSFLTGKEPVDREKELILDEHVECGCECSQELERECSGHFNKVSCECECPSWEFGERKAYCELRKDSFWDPKSCQCQSRTVAARGIPDYNTAACEHTAERHLEIINALSPSNNRALDMILWVVLGSSLTLVLALSITTYHYRNKLLVSGKRLTKEKEHKMVFDVGDSSSSQSVIPKERADDCKVLRRIYQSSQRAISPTDVPDLDMLDDDFLISRDDKDGPRIDQYNEHGVQIENNCFE